MLRRFYRYLIGEPLDALRAQPRLALATAAGLLAFAALQAATGGHALALLFFILLGAGILLRVLGLIFALIRWLLFIR